METEVKIIDRDEHGDPLEITFRPVGHVELMHFRRNCNCGRAKRSTYVDGYGMGGGVMTKNQMIALRDLLNKSIDESNT